MKTTSQKIKNQKIEVAPLEYKESLSYSEGSILTPNALEGCIRKMLMQGNRHGSTAIMIALNASKLHGNRWFQITNLVRKTMPWCATDHPGKDADRLKDLGVVDTKKIYFNGKEYQMARLTCETTSIEYFHGNLSLICLETMDEFYRRYPRNTALAALLILGMIVYKIDTSIALKKFGLPQRPMGVADHAVVKNLKKMEEMKMINTYRMEDGGPYTMNISFIQNN